jgi:P-type Cu+ transporter
MVVDPACGMIVDDTHVAEAAVYRDRRYFFCSVECRTAFQRNPEGYLKDQPPPRAAAMEETPTSTL